MNLLYSPDALSPPANRRANYKKVIERYFHLLTVGCGNSNCTNKHCFSSGKVETMNPNEAAIRAIHLFADDKNLLEENSCSKKVVEPIVHSSPFSSSVLIANRSDDVPLPRRLVWP